MRISQQELAHKWGVGKSIISRYVARGMPLSSEWDAQRWVSANVRTNKINFRATEDRKAKPIEPEPYFDDDDGEDELLRVENERDQLLHSAWKRFKKKPIFVEDAPGYSEAELVFCWAVKGLVSNRVSEEDALAYASFAAIVTGAASGIGWEPNPSKPKEKVPAKG
jgi:hypothetical protein